MQNPMMANDRGSAPAAQGTSILAELNFIVRPNGLGRAQIQDGPIIFEAIN